MADDRLISLMSSKLAYLGQRQAVLAQNIANADTPDYKPRDLQPFAFSTALAKASDGMMVTDAKHIVPENMAGVNANTLRMKPYETLPSGNAVDLEQQSLAVSKNAIDYQGVTALYKSVSGWFRTALGRSSG